MDVTAAPEIVVRKANPTDQSYIAATWTHSLTGGGVAHGAKRRWANYVVDRLLDDESVRVLVAADRIATSTILGWLCYTAVSKKLVLHYVYVRERMRLQGIARALHAQAVQDAGGDRLVYTLKGPSERSLVKRYPNAIHLPVEDFLS